MTTTTTKLRLESFLQLALLPLLSGCSALGFSTNPVAHVMTSDTKDVLAETPNNVDVARELTKEVQPAHFLQPGDELLVETIDGDSDVRLPADQQVLADGSIDLGRYGRTVIAGMTLEQAEASVQRAVFDVTGQPTRVNVRMIAPIHRYYVIGEVNSPGAYPLTGHETVLDAIMEAGGLTPRASACDLLLARPTDPCSCRVTLPVCYRAITQLGDTMTNYHLKPGDRIFVARQSLTEELSSYLCGGKTCSRCCDQQVACRNPRVASNDLPSFIHPPIDLFAPIDPPDADATPDTDEMPEQRLLEDRSLEQSRVEPRPLLPGRVFEPQLDGELDFGNPVQ